MKLSARLCAIISAFSILFFPLHACSEISQNADTAELIEAVKTALKEDIGRGITYFDRTRNPENGDIHIMEEERFGYLYTGRIEPLPCRSRIKSYAVYLPSDIGGCEIHVIECVNPSDTEEITLFLQKRIKRLKSSEILSIAPENSENCFKDAEVFTKGRFAFLLATPDNGAAKKAISRFL